MQSVFITGADRGIGFALVKKFVESGWEVYAGQFMPKWNELQELKIKHPESLFLIPLNVADDESVFRAAKMVGSKTGSIDILVNCAGVLPDDKRPETLKNALNVNTIGPLRVVEAFLHLMEHGMKRLCFVSSEVGSITLSHRAGDFYYCCSKAALNMEVRLIYNQLRKEGFTFRLYHPGYVKSYMLGKKNQEADYEPEETAETAYKQFTGQRKWEDVLLMTDVEDEIWTF